MQGWLAARLAPARPLLTLLNGVLASEIGCTVLAVGIALGREAPLIAFAAFFAPILETTLKNHVDRARPNDPHDRSFPSGDCLIATAVWPHLLGVWALPIVAVVALARMVRGAHWPLDVLAGAGLGGMLWALAR